MLNPLGDRLQQFRHAMITHATPSAAALGGVALLDPIGSWWRCCSASSFQPTAPYVAENL